MIASLCMLECGDSPTANMSSPEVTTATTASSSHVLSISTDRFVRIHRISDWKEVVGYECRSSTIECVDYIGLNRSPYFICPGGAAGNLLQLIHWKQIRLADQLDLQHSIVKIVEMKTKDQNNRSQSNNAYYDDKTEFNKKTTTTTMNKTVIAATKNTIEIISVIINSIETTFNHATLLNRVCSIPFSYNLHRFDIVAFNQLINQNINNISSLSNRDTTTPLLQADKQPAYYGRITALSCSRSAQGIIIILSINNGAILKLQNLGFFQEEQQHHRKHNNTAITSPSHWVCIQCETSSNIPVSPVMCLWQNANVFVSIHADSRIIQWEINTCQVQRSFDVHNKASHNNSNGGMQRLPLNSDSHQPSLLAVQISSAIGAITFPDRIGFITLDTLEELECISMPSETITAIVYSQESSALIIAIKNNNNNRTVIHNLSSSHKPSLHGIPLPSQVKQFIHRKDTSSNSPKKMHNKIIDSTIKTNLSEYLNSNNNWVSDSPAVNPISTEGFQTLNSQLFDEQAYNYNTQQSINGQVHLNSINLNVINNAIPITNGQSNPFLQMRQIQQQQQEQQSKLNHNHRYSNNNNNNNSNHPLHQHSDDVIQPLSTSQSPYKSYYVPEPIDPASAYIDSNGRSRLISKNDPLRKQLFVQHNSASPLPAALSPSPSQQYQHHTKLFWNNDNPDDDSQLKTATLVSQIFPSQYIKSPWELMSSSQQTRTGVDHNAESYQTQKYELTTKCYNTNSNTNVGSSSSYSSSVSQQKQQQQQQYSYGPQNRVKLSDTKAVTQFQLSPEDTKIQVNSKQYLTTRPREYLETQLNGRQEQQQQQQAEVPKNNRNINSSIASVSLTIPSEHLQKHKQQNSQFRSYLLQTYKPEKSYSSLAAFKAQASKSVDLNAKSRINSSNGQDKSNLTAQMKSPNSFERIESIVNQKRSLSGGINKEKVLQQQQQQQLRGGQLDGDLKGRDDRKIDNESSSIDSNKRIINNNDIIITGKTNETQIGLITNQAQGTTQLDSQDTTQLHHYTHGHNHHHNHSTTLPVHRHQMQSVDEDLEPEISSENLSETQETSFQALQSSLQQQPAMHSQSDNSRSSLKSRSQNSSMRKLQYSRDKGSANSSNNPKQTFEDLIGKLHINSADKNQLLSLRSNHQSKKIANSITDTESAKKRTTKQSSRTTLLGQNPQALDASDKNKKNLLKRNEDQGQISSSASASASKQRAITSTTMFKKMMSLQKDAEALTKRVRNLEDESMYFRAEIADINRVNKRFQNEIKRYCSVSNMRSYQGAKEEEEESYSGNHKKSNQLKERKHNSNKSFNGVSLDGSSDQKRQKRALSSSNYISKGARIQTNNTTQKEDLFSTGTLKDKIMETLEVYKKNLRRNESQAAPVVGKLHYRGILAGVPYYAQNSESARKKTQSSLSSNMSSYNNVSRVLDLQNKDSTEKSSNERSNQKEKKQKNKNNKSVGQFDFVEMNKRYVSPLKWNTKYSPLRESNNGKGKDEESLKKQAQLYQRQEQELERPSSRRLSSGSQNLLTTEFSALGYTEETGKKTDNKGNNQGNSIGKQERSYLVNHKDQQLERRQLSQQYQQSSAGEVSVSPVLIKYDFNNNNNNQHYQTQQQVQQQQPYRPSTAGVSTHGSSIPKEFENCLNGIKQFLEQNKSDLIHLKRDIQLLADKRKAIKE